MTGAATALLRGPGKTDAAATGPALPYRLAVVSEDVADVVRCAGGLICDRALAGWRVEVHLARSGDTRPIEILGAAIGQRAATDSIISSVAAVRTLALGADQLNGHAGLLSEMLASLNSADTQVLVWDIDVGQNRRPDVASAHHRLSAAAHAFKAHALIAAGLAATVGSTERFWAATPSRQDVGPTRPDEQHAHMSDIVMDDSIPRRRSARRA